MIVELKVLDVDIECEDCCDPPDAEGYVIPALTPFCGDISPYSDLHLCPEAFSGKRSNLLGEVFLHELSHLAADTGDYGYVDHSSSSLGDGDIGYFMNYGHGLSGRPELDSGTLIQNADTYSEFLRDLYITP